MIYAVGDVHGDIQGLRRILGLISEDAEARGIARPRTVFLGDYVDRGVASAEVLDLLSSGNLPVDPIFLLGNHDQAMLSVLGMADRSEIDHGLAMRWLKDFEGADTVESYGVALKSSPERFLLEFANAVPTAHRRFLKRLRRSWRKGSWFFCHAGVDPRLGLSVQPLETLLFGDKAFLALDVEPLAATEARRRLGAVVVHGHWCSPEVLILPHRVCVDTGASSRHALGRLSAVAIEGGEVRVVGCEDDDRKLDRLRREIEIGLEDAKAGRFSKRTVREIFDDVRRENGLPPRNIEREDDR